ncbi:unnamed protein product [Zymoseptoria tritici ST99CH_3D1]|nr:unnamed protein product [Zymoseptoria tritici ST99CH_3D1]
MATGNNDIAVDNLISVLGAAASAANVPTPAMAQLPSAEAVSVLISALPSDVVASIQSEFGALRTPAPTPAPTSVAQSTPSSPSSTIPTSSQSTPTSSDFSSSSTTASSSTFSPSTISSTSSATPTSSAGASTHNGQKSHNKAAVAGIASGIIAGAVLLILLAAFLFKCRKEGYQWFCCCCGKKKQHPRPSRPYPQSAWLYDARPSPPDSLRRGAAESSDDALLPTRRHDEMRERDRVPDRFASPTRPARPSSPLLSPPKNPGRTASPILSSHSRIRMVPSSPRSSEVDARRAVKTTVAPAWGQGAKPMQATVEEYHAH